MLLFEIINHLLQKLLFRAKLIHYRLPELLNLWNVLLFNRLVVFSCIGSRDNHTARNLPLRVVSPDLLEQLVILQRHRFAADGELPLELRPSEVITEVRGDIEGDLVEPLGSLGQFLFLSELLFEVELLLVGEIFCDPVELRSDSRLGVPGLLEVARAGRVAIANPLGSGVLENPILLKYMPAISKALLGREPCLQSVKTYWCGDDADLAFVTANIR